MKIDLIKELVKRAVVFIEKNGSVYLRDGEEITKELFEIQELINKGEK